MISRRDFLKLVPTALASTSMVGLPEIQPPACVPNTLYKGVNLKGWTVAVGDATYARPGDEVTLGDIQTAHFPTYSELRANVKRRIIMAHNITYKPVVNPNALNYIHTCTFYFRLPYIPQPDVSATLNGESLEAGIFVWDGVTTHRDYGMAFQWMLNPWSSPGSIRAWTNKISKGKWVNTGDSLSLDTKWHKATMVVDFKRQSTALSIDDKRYFTQFSVTPKPAFGSDFTARFQVEIVSVYPEPSGMNAMHRAQFRDWTWLWEPAACTV